MHGSNHVGTALFKWYTVMKKIKSNQWPPWMKLKCLDYASWGLGKIVFCFYGDLL